MTARHGRIGLVLGLLGGLLLPGLALWMRDWLPLLVSILLFLTAFRIGAAAALGTLAQGRDSLKIALVFQFVLPALAILCFTLAGVMGSTMAVVLVLMLSAPSVTASASFTILLEHDPAPALRLMLLGTALFPLSSLPALWAVPTLGDASEVYAASLRIILTIAGAVTLAFASRALLIRRANADFYAVMDGLSVIALAIVVIGLMSAVRPALEGDPLILLAWLAFAFAANFGFQLASWFLLPRILPSAAMVPASIVAGNRNIALYLVALPPETIEPLLIFLGCYQIPMYLTPILMRALYRNHEARKIA